MPKDRRDRSVSFDRSRGSPFPCSSSRARQPNTKNAPESEENAKEYEEARCPVCMEHPHNAVLLMCSSHDKGCRPYMCDTSYRHSNCLDQFRKSFSETTPQDGNTTEVASSEATVSNSQAVGSEEVSSNKEKLQLVCPLCRGKVTGWTIVDSARCFMNAKSRTCASETCEFCGTYADLRKHAREEHPLVRPSEADPERARNWRRLERQRDLGDLISTIQSLEEERSEESILSSDDRGWLTVFFLIRVFRPGNSSSSRAHVTLRRRSTRHWGEAQEEETEPNDEDSDGGTRQQVRSQSTVDDANSSMSSGWSGGSRARAQARVRRRSTRPWGETLEVEAEPVARDGDNNEASGGGSGSRRTRRRLRRQVTSDDEV